MISLVEIVRQVRVALFDQLARYWTDQEIIDGLNSGRVTLYAMKPRTYEVTEVVTLVAGYRQTLPNDSSYLFRPIENVTASSKRGITIATLELVTRGRPRWRTESQSNEIMHVMYVDSSPKEYEVYPPAREGTQIRISYAKMPAAIQLADIEASEPVLLAAELEQADPLIDWTVHRCLLKESDSSPQAAARSAQYLQLAISKFTGESSGKAKSNPNTTPIGNAPPRVQQ
ncbi:MAG: DUF6682 family protein [Lautropia sp.]